MKVLFLGSVFATENEKEILENSKVAVEYSANNFQKKMIDGFKEVAEDFFILSAPGIASFPKGYRKMQFKGFSVAQSEYEYVKFNNIWGIRNRSRAKNVKKALRPFIAATDEEKLIVVYSAHTPFLQAATYAKRKDSRIKICLVIPDLPQYMNLSANQSLLYRLGKRYDINKFNKLLPNVDSFMFLTEEMNKKLNKENKPYIVVEGIVGENDFQLETNKEERVGKYIVYTGKLYERFGVNNLVRAFERLQEENYRLILCGAGDSEEFIKKEASKDERIWFKGQVTADEAKQWIKQADVLVNPRPNNEEYTKYSFPSKNIEYLASGKPVVAYMLDGMKQIYRDFLYIPKDGSIYALAQSLLSAIEQSNEYTNKDFMKYCKEKLTAKYIAKEIIRIGKS
ncbi:MAG: glycosyltransferase family 4 protein [Clostridiales bacterium]|nr:glycosyltransferase family 4 protein [Clostridiales bacterium]